MIIAGLAILGVCIGSFINALVYRLHWQETNPKAAKKQKQAYSIKSGRSICPNCRHRLAAKDLIPIFSWLALRGRCRYCHKPISWQYPLVEFMTAVLFITSYVFWPQSLDSPENIINFAVWLACLAGFVALIVYDIRYLILPNKIIFPLLGLSALGVLFESAITSNLEPITSAALGAAIGGGLFYLLFQVSKGAWIGGGDVKLGFLLGILVGGPLSALLMLFIASFLGTVYSLPLILTKKVKPKAKIPFGPFLIVAAIVVQLFGTDITDWYLNYFVV